MRNVSSLFAALVLGVAVGGVTLAADLVVAQPVGKPSSGKSNSGSIEPFPGAKMKLHARFHCRDELGYGCSAACATLSFQQLIYLEVIIFSIADEDGKLADLLYYNAQFPAYGDPGRAGPADPRFAEGFLTSTAGGARGGSTGGGSQSPGGGGSTSGLCGTVNMIRDELTVATFGTQADAENLLERAKAELTKDELAALKNLTKTMVAFATVIYMYFVSNRTK